MKTLYLMRHGQTMFNVAHKIQGWCDAPLTDLGRAQAEVAGQWFRNRNITFDSPGGADPSYRQKGLGGVSRLTGFEYSD